MTLVSDPRYWIAEFAVSRQPPRFRGIDAGSATTGHNAGLHVFTSSAPPFEPGGNYSKFHVYTLLNHHGDFGAAAKALAEQGYGSRPPQRSQSASHSWAAA